MMATLAHIQPQNPYAVNLAASTLFRHAGPEAASMIESLARIVASGDSPLRLAQALEAWSLRVKELHEQGGSSVVTVAHNIHRGKTAGLDVVTTHKF